MPIRVIRPGEDREAGVDAAGRRAKGGSIRRTRGRARAAVHQLPPGEPSEAEEGTGGPLSTTSRRIAVTGVAAAAAIGVFIGLGPTPGGASSHREAPLIAADPQADNTDPDAFGSPDAPDTVTIVSNFIPFEE